MRIGIYGGTFDPPHAGHLNVIRQAMSLLSLDKLILVPAAVPPHKQLSGDAAPPEERLKMVRIAADGLLMGDKVEVDDLELRRKGPSYTSDTLRQLKKRYPSDELWFLMGTDMLMSFSSWHEPEVIAAQADLAVFSRYKKGGDGTLQEAADRVEKEFGTHVRVFDADVVETSSTQIRKELGRGKRPRDLPAPVYGHILRSNLYGTHADMEHLTDADLRACSLSMVYAKRYKHILGVEETAVKLANHWGANPELARRSGILHDCTKYLSLGDHLTICAAAGIELDDMERSSEKLLHAKSGAAIAKLLYGQPDEVYRAIFWHTTGRANMTLLEKIIYLADYMEPNRDFDGVDRLRQLCYTDLDAALEMGLEMSVADLRERGVPIHKNTQGALDWVRAHRKGLRP